MLLFKMLLEMVFPHFVQYSYLFMLCLSLGSVCPTRTLLKDIWQGHLLFLGIKASQTPLLFLPFQKNLL